VRQRRRAGRSCPESVASAHVDRLLLFLLLLLLLLLLPVVVLLLLLPVVVVVVVVMWPKLLRGGGGARVRVRVPLVNKASARVAPLRLLRPPLGHPRRATSRTRREQPWRH
jgi:hypothetical protein